MQWETQNLTDRYGKYARIEKHEIPVVDVKMSTDSTLLQALLSTHRYVYVENDAGNLYGIISRNDYRDKFHSNNHINTHYCFVKDDSNISETAALLTKEKHVNEFPVLSDDGQLLYVLRKKKNIILTFDFDWTLCYTEDINNFFSKYSHIYYISLTTKISNLIDRISSSFDIDRIDDLSICQEDDLVICEGYLGNNKCSWCSIDEIYLTILSVSAVRRLSANGIKYYFFQCPEHHKLRPENRVYLTTNINTWSKEDLAPIYEDDVKDMQYLLNRDNKNISFGEINGRYLPLDATSETYNVRNNERVTVAQPQNYRHTIWVIGTCIVRGFSVCDENTIPSILQSKLNDNGYKDYIVRNLGTGGDLNLYSDIRDFVNILRTDVSEGDLVLHLGHNCWELMNSKVNFDEYYELSWLFNRKHNRRCFLNGCAHLTPYANRKATDYIYEIIQKELIKSY